MTADELIQSIKTKSSGRTRWKGSEPYPDEILVAEIEQLRAEKAALIAALQSAVKIAHEARVQWDEAPSGMRAGKLLIALSGKCPDYRADIDAIHAAISKATGSA